MVSFVCLACVLSCSLSLSRRVNHQPHGRLDAMGVTIPQDLGNYNISNRRAFVENVEKTLLGALSKNEVCAITYEPLFESGTLRDGVCALADDTELATLHLYFCSAILQWIDRGNPSDPMNPDRRITRSMLVPLSHLETPLNSLNGTDAMLSEYTSSVIVDYLKENPLIFSDKQLQLWAMDKQASRVRVGSFSKMMADVCKCDMGATCWALQQCVGHSEGDACQPPVEGSCGASLQCTSKPRERSVKGFYNTVRRAFSSDLAFVDGLSSEALKNQLNGCFWSRR